MRLAVYGLSHIGLKRTSNQDNFYCNGVCAKVDDNSFRYYNKIENENPSLFAVFDGMGGHVHGERAAQIAVEEADKAFQLYRQGSPEQLLNSICLSANRRICDEMLYSVKGRMGSTAALLLFERQHFFLSNLGDSPVFLIRNDEISTISCEHSERKNYEEIFGKNYDPHKKFKLTQHLGIFPDELQISPYYISGELKTGDVFILCSDGLTDMVTENEIINSINANKNDVRTAAENLLSIALNNGGKDNITVIICKVETINTNEPNNTLSDNSDYYTKTVLHEKKNKVLIFIITLTSLLIAVSVVAFIVYKVFDNAENKMETQLPTQYQTETVETMVTEAEAETQTQLISTTDEVIPSLVDTEDKNSSTTAQSYQDNTESYSTIDNSGNVIND